MPAMQTSRLDRIHHVAIVVDDVGANVRWYSDTFRCRVSYQDDTWALLEFENMSLALVTNGQHPPHLGLVSDRAQSFGELKSHRDGTRSLYVADPAGNAVELLDPDYVATRG